MPITVSALFNDSTNFMRNQLSKFVVLALLTAFIQFSLLLLFPADFRAIDETYKTNFTGLAQNSQESNGADPSQELIDAINRLTPEAKIEFTKDAMAIGLKQYSIIVATNSLLVTWTVVFILSIVNGWQTGLMQTISRSFIYWPKILLLSFLSLILTGIGFTLLILPGIVLCFGLAMAPIIAIATSNSILSSMGQSFKFMTRYPGPIISAVLFSIAFSLLGDMLLSLLLLPFNSTLLSLFMGYLFSDLLLIFFTIYFYRLFSSVQGPSGI